jgi:RNA polymerase sigma-70 factor (ECF subfamily)
MAAARAGSVVKVTERVPGVAPETLRAHAPGQPIYEAVAERPLEPTTEALAETLPDAPADPVSDTASDPGSDEPYIRDLVARAQAGEADAFGELYDRYVRLIYRYIYYRVGGVELAEDLTSETFLRALRRLDSFSWQGRDIGAWFVTIARNLIADHFKSSRYRMEISTDTMLAAERGMPSAAGPESEVLAHLTNETLIGAIRKLVPEQQECVVLRFLEGLSVNETALAMSKNDGAIKALQYRAVRSLARLLPEGTW